MLRRSLMDANGENTGKKWRRETHALVLITVVPWPRLVQFVNKYDHFLKKPFVYIINQIYIIYIYIEESLCAN